jgi:hypothetical protein
MIGLVKLYLSRLFLFSSPADVLDLSRTIVVERWMGERFKTKLRLAPVVGVGSRAF